MEFTGRITKDGSIDFGERNAAIFKKFRAENVGMVLKIIPVLPESNKQRAYPEGAIIPLVTFYQEGMDHRSSEDCRKVREWLKLEFNSEVVSIDAGESGSQVHRIAKSTKGREALNAFLERVMDWLHDNCSPPAEAIDPQSFITWRDTVMPYGGPDNYIDYLVETGVLKAAHSLEDH
jgi:hypothetical protein